MKNQKLRNKRLPEMKENRKSINFKNCRRFNDIKSKAKTISG